MAERQDRAEVSAQFAPVEDANRRPGQVVTVAHCDFDN